MEAPVQWFGLPPSAWQSSPERSFSMALWQMRGSATGAFHAVQPSDSHMICVHMNGRMDWSAKFDGRKYDRPAEPNTFCLARAGESVYAEYRDADISFVHFYLPVRWFETDASDCNSDGHRRTLELIDPMNSHQLAVGSIARRAARALRYGGPAARLEIESSVLDLGARLIRDHSNGYLQPHCRGGLSPASLRRVIEAMRASVQTGIGLEALAAVAGLSSSHFCRAFAVQTGLSPHRYQTALRLERAQILLSTTSMSISDVASAAGYDDPAYFGRAFRREIGFTPSEWRQECGR